MSKAQEYQTKDSVVIVYTGEGKGKTSAAMGLLTRALGTGWTCAFVQFIKHWKVGEHDFITQIEPIYQRRLTFFKGGKGFYNLGDLSAKDVSETEHQEAALATFKFAQECATSGDYQLVICDEINNAVHDGLLQEQHLETLMTQRDPATSLCLTGRNFPQHLLRHADIATNMDKMRHHFDDKFLANKGIDY